MKKMRKGKLNYLWYEQLHKKYDLGLIYYVNKAYTLVFAAAVIIHLLLGWIKEASMLFCILFCISQALLVVLNIFSDIEYLINEFGTPFVILRQNKRKGLDSILFIPFSAGLIIMSGAAQVKMALDFYM